CRPDVVAAFQAFADPAFANCPDRSRKGPCLRGVSCQQSKGGCVHARIIVAGLVEDLVVPGGGFSKEFSAVFCACRKGEVLGDAGAEGCDVGVKRCRDAGSRHVAETELQIALACLRGGARTRESEYCRVLERGILRMFVEPAHSQVIGEQVIARGGMRARLLQPTVVVIRHAHSLVSTPKHSTASAFCPRCRVAGKMP